jgi:hypothetical protein
VVEDVINTRRSRSCEKQREQHQEWE